MNFITEIFNTILYRPLLNFLILLYNYIPGHDFGVAIILLTIIIKFLLYPLGSGAIKSQKALAEVQPKIKEIQEKYKDDKERQTKEIMAFYKEAKVNPFSGCLPVLIQLPILLALYRVFWHGFQLEQISHFLYGFMPHIDSINASFLGLVDLSRSWFIETDGIRHYLWPNIILIILVALAQFWQTKISSPKTSVAKKGKNHDFSSVMQKQMQYFMPLFTALILLSLPAAVALYWLVNTLFSIIQQHFVFKKNNP